MKRILVTLDMNYHYSREVLRGVSLYARGRDLTIQPCFLWHELQRVVERGQGDCAIVQISPVGWGQWLEAREFPFVNVGGGWGDRFLPRVGWDQRAAAEQAARHLLERGLRSFGYVYLDGFDSPASLPHDRRRAEGFRDAVEAEGGSYREFAPGGQADLLDELAQWLRDLPLPCGVFAFNDRRAMDVLVAARLAELHVPEEIAVVGMDNDADICEAADPPLSSVALDARRIGFRAAQTVEALLQGGEVEPVQLVPLPGVVTRRSSDVFHADNAEVAAVLRFIRDHAGEKITTADLLEIAPMNRRRLERLVKKHYWPFSGRRVGARAHRARARTSGAFRFAARSHRRALRNAAHEPLSSRLQERDRHLARRVSRPVPRWVLKNGCCNSGTEQNQL